LESRWHTTVDEDVVIEFATLLACLDVPPLFSGFDEIWLCTAMPALGKPAHLRITSDQPLGSEPTPELAEWMLVSSCRAGLGDGDGLNFATFDPALASASRRGSGRRGRAILTGDAHRSPTKRWVDGSHPHGPAAIP
jgi:hypothetical protein